MTHALFNSIILTMKKEKGVTMSFLKKILLMLLPLAVMVGCSMEMNNDDSLDKLSNDELALEYESRMNLIESEFYDGIPGTQEKYEGVNPADIPENMEFDDLGLKEQIQLLAYEAANTGDDTKLKILLSDNDLLDKYNDLLEKYNIPKMNEKLAYTEKSRSFGLPKYTKKYAPQWMWNLQMGDILLMHEPGSFFAGLVPGRWDHAGIVDTRGWGSRNDLRVLSCGAYNETHSKVAFDVRYACVGYESLYHYASIGKTAAYRVRSTTSTQRRKALDYMKQFLGRKYSLLSSKSNTSTFNCCEVPYRAWLSQGRTIQAPNGSWKWFGKTYYTYGSSILPSELADDNDTYFVAGNMR